MLERFYAHIHACQRDLRPRDRLQQPCRRRAVGPPIIPARQHRPVVGRPAPRLGFQQRQPPPGQQQQARQPNDLLIIALHIQRANPQSAVFQHREAARCTPAVQSSVWRMRRSRWPSRASVMSVGRSPGPAGVPGSAGGAALMPGHGSGDRFPSARRPASRCAALDAARDCPNACRATRAGAGAASAQSAME